MQKEEWKVIKLKLKSRSNTKHMHTQYLSKSNTHMQT